MGLEPQAATVVPETVFFGGTAWAPDSMRWEALRDSVWTFDTGVGSAIKESGHTYPGVDLTKPDGFHAYMEGWTGLDQTAPPPQYFRRLTADDPRWGPEGACVGTAAGLGGNASFWAGLLPEEAAALCYASGQGYGDNWNICISHSFQHNSGPVTLEYDFRNETELYDRTDVVVEKAGTRTAVASYSGTWPGHEVVQLDQTELPDGPGTVIITFCVISDQAWSDEDGLYPTTCGAFAVDNITLSGKINYFADFETNDGGWTVVPPPPGTSDWTRLVSRYDLPGLSPGALGNCTLADSVLVLFDPDTDGHPSGQKNVAVSPWIDLKAAGADGHHGKIIELDGYFDLPLLNYLFVLTEAQWRPYVCSGTGIETSPWVTPGFVYYFGGNPTCLDETNNWIHFDTAIPDDAEQVRIGVGVWDYCRFYSDCSGLNNTTPWFDNIRFGVYDHVPTLQDRVDAASEGDTVRVAPGTYTGPGNWDLDFGLKNLVFLGTAGPESTFIECSGDTVGHRGFLFVEGDHSASVVEGLTIRHGSADKTGDDKGGGIWVDCPAGPTIRNCVFDSCMAQSGGGIGVWLPVGVVIDSCRFHDNTCTGHGGGVLGGQLIRGCVFDGNSASEGGGAATDARIENSTFTGNRAQVGGGLRGTAAEVYDSEFVGNFAGGHIIRGHGGGIWGGKRVERCILTNNTARYGAGIYTGELFATTTKLYIDCTLRNNAASNSGGGVSLTGHVKISGCLIQGNTAPVGGGVDADRGAYGYYPEVENTTITGNVATFGGGIAVGDSANVNGCTISGNRATSGGGIYVYMDSHDVSNRTIVWGNCSTGIGQEVCVAGSTSTAEFTCSSLDTTGIAGDGILLVHGPQNVTDPLFCDPGDCGAAPSFLGNYTLAAGSPCLPASNTCGVLIGAQDQGCAAVTGVGDHPTGPKPPGLAAYPNPFTGSLHVSFTGPEGATGARVEIFDVRGRLVWTRDLPEPSAELDWNGRDGSGRRAAPGVYFVHVRSGPMSKSARVVLIR